MKSSFPEDTNTTIESKYYTLHTLVPNSIRFPLLLTLEIPSVICYIFVIGYILSKKSRRSASNNYIMLIILFISFITIVLYIPWELNYYREYTTSIRSITFCLIGWFIDLWSFCTCQILVAWASIERHILIFHDRLLNQKWKKICYHYMPPLLLIVYMMSFYIYVLFLIPCEYSIIFDNNMCVVPCYLNNPKLTFWESIFHGLVTTLCIIVFNCALVIRVYRSRARLQQLVNWRKYRKMMLQLIAISSLYLSINLPFFIICVISVASSFDWTPAVLECLDFVRNLIPLFLPFIYLMSLPKIWTKIKRRIHGRANRQIQPIPLRPLVKNDRIENA